jgi:transketolase
MAMLDTNKIRRDSLISIYHAKSGHPGGVLSSIDIIAHLFGCEMDYDVTDFSRIDRDRFILSKGHCAPALYATGAAVGLVENSRLRGLRKLNHELQGHTHRVATPWVEASTGSLGQGFSFAVGEAKGLQIQQVSNRVYVMLGDGELQEGEVWEGAMFAAHHGLDNLCAIIDYNKMQSDDLNANIMGLEPLADKWSAFGWHVIEIDGHNDDQIGRAFADAKATPKQPTVIIAHTIKGKGVSYMEGSPAWHGSLKLSDDDLTQALRELGGGDDEIRRSIDE